MLGFHGCFLYCERVHVLASILCFSIFFESRLARVCSSIHLLLKPRVVFQVTTLSSLGNSIKVCVDSECVSCWRYNPCQIPVS